MTKYGFIGGNMAKAIIGECSIQASSTNPLYSATTFQGAAESAKELCIIADSIRDIIAKQIL